MVGTSPPGGRERGERGKKGNFLLRKKEKKESGENLDERRGCPPPTVEEDHYPFRGEEKKKESRESRKRGGGGTRRINSAGREGKICFSYMRREIRTSGKRKPRKEKKGFVLLSMLRTVKKGKCFHSPPLSGRKKPTLLGPGSRRRRGTRMQKEEEKRVSLLGELRKAGPKGKKKKKRG